MPVWEAGLPIIALSVNLALKRTACHLMEITNWLFMKMGHQFGASHTYNGSELYCGNYQGSNQRVQTTAYEPGSGSTLMSYAGSCGFQNLQGSKDDYFHAGSIAQMWNIINSSGSCASQNATGNGAPSVNAGSNYVIPKGTPFKLTATGSDSDPLTYTWEEADTGAVSPPDSDGDGEPRPIFRSRPGTSSPSRTFPDMGHVRDQANVPTAPFGGYLPGEALPLISRIMKFTVTARDNRSGGGGVSSADTLVTVDGGSEPFFVTALHPPNTPMVWTSGSTQIVTWNVGNTATSPINCSQVKISLSTDGGLTFPTNLLTSTPNDGSESVLVPNITTTAARVKVEGVGNIFFDISDTNFPIKPSGCTFGLNPASVTVGSLATSPGVYNTFNLTAPGGCSWVAKTNVNWITFKPGNDSGTGGNANIKYQVMENNGAPRVGLITIEGLIYTVNQNGICNQLLNQTSAAVTFTGGSRAVTVSGTNCSWYATSNTPWITIISGRSGTGPGSVIYSVAKNSEAIQRVGTLSIAGQTYTVTQTAFSSAPLSKLSGIVFGTLGSYWGGPNVREYVYDGNIQTRFDAPDPDGGYAGIDIGIAKVIKKIRFFPRSDWSGGPDRMAGGRFQGSNAGVDTGFNDLHSIPSAIPSGFAISSWVEITIDNPTAYRYLRYLSPNGAYCNVAEVEFYSDESTSQRFNDVPPTHPYYAYIERIAQLNNDRMLDLSSTLLPRRYSHESSDGCVH